MSDGQDDGYAVGYGKPPVENRFQKGKSGNPRGRPRGKKKPTISTEFGLQAAESMLLAEAYRPVKLREGDQVIEMPAIQAVFRSLGVQAVKGNRLAAKDLAAMVQNVEREHYDLRLAHFKEAMEYKLGWEERFAEYDRAGRPRPEPVPHPADIHFDPKTSGVRVLGPMTPEGKQRLDKAIARRAEAQAEVTANMDAARKARDPERKLWWKKEALYEQRIFDIINDNVPERYKARLEGRLWRQEDLDLLPPRKKRRARLG